MNTRLKQFLAAENISQAQFADNINVVRASVSHVLSGRNNPSYEFIRSIMLKYPNLNIEWLMFGKGKMYKEKTVSPAASDVLFPEIDEQVPSINDKAPETAPVVEPQAIMQPSSAADIHVLQRKVSKIIVLFDDGTFQER